MSWSPPRTRNVPKVVSIALACTLMTSACVKPDQPGVQVDAKSAELVFGVGDLAAAESDIEETIVEELDRAAPVSVEIAAPRARSNKTPLNAFTGNDFDLPFFFDDDPPRPRRPRVCYPDIRRPAPALANSSQASASPPEEGTYMWRTTDFIGPAEAPTSVTSYAPHVRVVTNVRQVVDEADNTLHGAAYLYDVIEPAGEYEPGKRQFLVSTMRVNPRPPEGVNPETVPAGASVSKYLRTRVRLPDSGLVLVRTELVDVEGNRVPGTTPFEPLVGVMLLPLPVFVGEHFESAAVDPKSGKVVRVQGDVDSEVRINACGEPVDGWQVNTTMNITTPGGGSAGFTYNYVAAPHYGGLLLKEDVIDAPTSAQNVPGSGTELSGVTAPGVDPRPVACMPSSSTSSSTSSTSSTSSSSTSSSSSTTTTTICASPITTPGVAPTPIAGEQTVPVVPIVPGEVGVRSQTTYQVGFLEAGDLLELHEVP